MKWVLGWRLSFVLRSGSLKIRPPEFVISALLMFSRGIPCVTIYGGKGLPPSKNPIRWNGS
jgi:hypothetical protein